MLQERILDGKGMGAGFVGFLRNSGFLFVHVYNLECTNSNVNPERSPPVISKTKPSRHDLMIRVYADILRGIHYRHEFARRDPVVRIKCEGIIDALGCDHESFSAFEGQDGTLLVDVLAKAYRKSKKELGGLYIKKNLATFFKAYGIMPIAPSGKPFLGEKIRFNPKTGLPSHKFGESDHIWLKVIWNKLLAFETFAMAEFSLPKPIMMPVMPLSKPRTKSGSRDLRQLVRVTPTSFPAYINIQQSTGVLGNYIAAFVEQAREAMLVAPPEDDAGFQFVSTHESFFEQYIDALDLDLRFNNRVPYSEKYDFYARHSKTNIRNAQADAIIKYFKESRRSANNYRDKWKMII